MSLMENYLPECEKMFSDFKKADHIIDFHVSERFFVSLWELNLEVTRWKWAIFTLSLWDSVFLYWLSFFAAPTPAPAP